MLIGLGINYYALEEISTRTNSLPLWVYNLIAVPIWAHSQNHCGQLRRVFQQYCSNNMGHMKVGSFSLGQHMGKHSKFETRLVSM